MKLETILITGATSGIGRHAALHFAKKGYRVFATGRSPSALEKLAAEAKGLDLQTIRLDVTDKASIEAARVEVDEKTNGQGLDVLINNAGFGAVAPTETMSEDDLRAMYETNVFGLLAVTRAFLPAMHKRGRGKILNVSSVGGRITLPLYGGYNSTKYAVESLSDALRRELAPFGIKVVLIEPGVIRTEFVERSLSFVDPKLDPTGRYGDMIRLSDVVRKQTEMTAVGPATVSRAMERAVRAKNPAARYVAPFRTSIMLALANMLPTSWLDGVLRLSLGLGKKSLRTAPAAAPALGN